MARSRLELACDSGLVTWPEGRVMAFRPDPETGGLPQRGIFVVHGFKPAVDGWLGHGVPVSPVSEGPADASYVQVPRSKALARQLVTDALDATLTGGPVVVDGQKTDGVESLLKEIRRVFEGVQVLAKSHGKLAVFERPDELPSQVKAWRRDKSGPAGWSTALSGFSADRVDAGSAMLAEHLPTRIKGTVLDLGAGWGFLAKRVLEATDVERVDLLEAEHDALAAARRNVTDPRAQFLWEDALNWTAEAPYDLVVCNPPFHSGRAADPTLGQGFIDVAAGCLAPNGTLALVANRHLPYERTLAAAFGQVQTVTEAQGFKVFHAQKPKGSRRKRR